MTVDETWIHYYEPENKAQNRQCVGPGYPRPKKLKTNRIFDGVEAKTRKSQACFQII